MLVAAVIKQMFFLLFITLVHIVLPLENDVLVLTEWHFTLNKDLFNRSGT